MFAQVDTRSLRYVNVVGAANGAATGRSEMLQKYNARKLLSGGARRSLCLLAPLALMAGPAMAQEATVCAIGPTTEIEYFATLLEEYQMAGDERGIEVITVDSQNDPAREASQIENCMARGVD